MANIKSAAKRARQSIVRTQRNQQTKKAVRTAEKKLREAVGAKDKTLTETLFKTYESMIGKAAQKGFYHKNTASRKVSRLALYINKSLNS